MPCAAPCVRLPCNKRCSKDLPCGHPCPGICGERCPEELCHTCCGKGDARVDLLEMKTYKEIDLDETPIIALACGHFFTAETLDGHMGMGAVYVMDGYGEFTGLKDVSSKLAQSIPCCPDCRSPVKQHATHRYNRVVNRAVIDEMSKRFLVDGQRELRALEQQTEELGQSLETSRAKILNILHQSRSSFTLSLRTIRSWEIEKELEVRQAQSIGLRKAIQSFCTKVAHKHQPDRSLRTGCADQRSAASAAAAIRNNLASPIVSPISINPTGASPGRWQGMLIAQRSRKLPKAVLRRTSRLTRL